jgi:hypothetical protein
LLPRRESLAQFADHTDDFVREEGRALTQRQGRRLVVETERQQVHAKASACSRSRLSNSLIPERIILSHRARREGSREGTSERFLP